MNFILKQQAAVHHKCPNSGNEIKETDDRWMINQLPMLDLNSDLLIHFLLSISYTYSLKKCVWLLQVQFP